MRQKHTEIKSPGGRAEEDESGIEERGEVDFLHYQMSYQASINTAP